MNEGVDRSNSGNALAVWASAGAVAGVGTWLLFDGMPGLNWFLWTATAALGAVALLQHIGRPLTRLSIAMMTVAVIMAGGAAISANEMILFLVFLSIVLFLAMGMLLAVDGRIDRLSLGFVVFAPIVAWARAVFESIRRIGEGSQLVRSPGARATLRGIAISAPVVLIFALLLAGADPVFARWRDELGRILEDLTFLPRTIFFIALLTMVLGAYGDMARGSDGNSGVQLPALPATRWLGATERLILLGSVAVLFWIFLAVQLSYLFGNLPEVPGSGVTFADYARRGFAELTIVATCTVLLIILSERYGQVNGRERVFRGLTMSIVIAVVLLLASAFHRVALYEAAYGYTTSRLYAQVYMIVVAVTLGALALEVIHGIDPRRLFRRAGLAALIALMVLTYWNHEAWIARVNIARFAATGKLDTVYLTRDLSPNAVPTVMRLLPTLPQPAQDQLRTAVKLRYEGRSRLKPRAWIEWNLGRAKAVEALEEAGISLEPRSP
ncbi:MAG TPA: DUF4173 domain-containing protein [Gemmatimonadaceae bacterium]|nr:DUF4173 domain-containing protein [Gemmatimonadaceae bacterium]